MTDAKTALERARQKSLEAGALIAMEVQPDRAMDGVTLVQDAVIEIDKAITALTAPFDPDKHLPERGWHRSDDTLWVNDKHDADLEQLDGIFEIGASGEHLFSGYIPTLHFFELLCEALGINIKP